MGKKVALVEEGLVGGTCLNVGCIPAKVFLRSSRLYRECGEAKAFGVEVDSFRFDLPAVVERKTRIVALSSGVGRPAQALWSRGLPCHARLVGRNRSKSELSSSARQTYLSPRGLDRPCPRSRDRL